MAKSNVVAPSSTELASAKIKVYGKAQNRTALGIMHAYMLMYPHARLQDIQKAFPDALNPDSGVKKNFVLAGEKGTTANWNGFFQKEEELLTMGDKTKVAVVSMWTKESFLRLINHAKQYGIVVADFEEAEKGIGKKGGFRLEYLNGYVPPKPKSHLVWWLLLGLVILCSILLLLRKCGGLFTETEKIVLVRDTVYIQQIEEIEKNYNAASFIAGKAELSDDAKFVLHDLAKVLKSNPTLRLKLEGHTSAEGNSIFNKKLSIERAKAAVEFLFQHEGVDATRLEYEGLGSTKLKNTENPNASENRRTEFIILEN